MKKVLIFSLTYFPFVGGAEIAIDQITERLSSFDFTLITARLEKKLPQQEKIGRVTVYRVGWGNILDKYLFPFLAYKKAIKLEKFDMSWAMMANYAGLAALFYKFRNRQIPYLLTLQSGDSELFMWIRTWFWYPLYKKIYTKADQIQAISQYLKNRAGKYGYTGKVDVIPNGVDLAVFTRRFNDETRERLKTDLGIKPDEKVIITTSRLVAKNAVSDLIRSVRNLPVRLIILGKGKLENRLRALSQEIGNHNKVIFLGEKKYAEIPGYLAIADIFCRPSLSEGLGNSFLEAMAAKVPVVATPVGGILDFLTDRKTGLFCEVRNPASISEKINEILNNDGLRRQLTDNAYKMVLENYNWDNIAGRMEKIFTEIKCQNPK
ncbi:glycosyltransferase family 1 protein [Candidatus Parcubacteria bacterium]|nr:MAG: glycosyltransferase family 1 protein [Candidatus Parcubacteria bacterium]